MQLEWNAPTQKHGELIGFRLRFGIQNQPLIEKILGPTETRFLIEDLGKEICCYGLVDNATYALGNKKKKTVLKLYLFFFSYRKRSDVRV